MIRSSWKGYSENYTSGIEKEKDKQCKLAMALFLFFIFLLQH